MEKVKSKLNCVTSITTLFVYIEKNIIMYGEFYLSSDPLCNMIMSKVSGRSAGGRHKHMDFGLRGYFHQHRNQETHQ